jgi:predicted acylesterase/phospholipase RssA
MHRQSVSEEPAVSPPTAREPYDAVVFAGGGCRCFWQAGFWAEAAPALDLAPAVVGAVSAGSAFACAIFAGVVDDVLLEFQRRVRSNPRNVYPANAVRGAPVFPHERIYRETILATLGPAALARLHRGPDIRVTVARPPRGLGMGQVFLMAALAYQGDNLTKPVHAQWGRRLGFTEEAISLRSCATPEEVADLILHSSCSPPALPLYRRAGRVVFDGGLVDNAPAHVVQPARHTLVLLTWHRALESLPRIPGRTYVQPSRPVPIDKWDYTSPERVQRTYDLGRRDGEAFARGRRRIEAA